MATKWGSGSAVGELEPVTIASKCHDFIYLTTAK